MIEGYNEKLDKVLKYNMTHFCSFEYFDGLAGKVKERSELFLDMRRKLLKVVNIDVLGNTFVSDFRISRFKEDSNAWYFWIKNSLTDLGSDDTEEFFGLGVTKEGQDYWGKLKIGKHKPTFFKLKTARIFQ